jgi:3',5'-cyclic AMP phosphodiesterase CpdA
MKTIAHISDIHFGRVDPEVAEALVADLHRRPPTLTVVSGDLTQRARRHQFEAARALLDRLPGPYLVIPGNHDIAAFHRPFSRLFRPFSRYRRYIADDLCPTYVDDGLAVVGINTARPLRRKEGSISSLQVGRVRRVLAGLDDRLFKVVVTHHPFIPPPAAPDKGVLGQAERALRVFEACSVDLLLAGHLHVAYTGDVTTHYTAIKRTILVAQAATATSNRLRREPNAYNWIAVHGPTLDLHTRVWDGTAFRESEAETFERRPGGWVKTRDVRTGVQPKLTEGGDGGDDDGGDGG